MGKFEKDSKARLMFSDYYRLAEKYWEIPADAPDDLWKALIDDADAFISKHATDTDEFAAQLAGLLISRCECAARGILPYCGENATSGKIYAALLKRRG